jgi:hypothetical protein
MKILRMSEKIEMTDDENESKGAIVSSICAAAGGALEELS